MDNIEILQVQNLIKMYRQAFSTVDKQPTEGSWINKGVHVMSEHGYPIAKFNNSVDAGYTAAVQPIMIKRLLDYIDHLENKIEATSLD